MENYDKYRELLEVSETSAGTAEKKYQSYKESYAAAKSELAATLEEFANSSEISKILTDLTHFAKGIVEMLQKIYPFIPAIVTNIANIKALSGNSILHKGYNMWQKYKAANPGSGESGWSTFVGNVKKITPSRKSKIPQDVSDILLDKKGLKVAKEKQKLSEKELKNKKQTAALGESETKLKGETASSAKVEEEAKSTVAADSSTEATNKAEVDTLAAQEAVKKTQVDIHASSELAKKQQVASTGSGSAGGGNATVPTKGGAKGGSAGVGLTALSIAANTVIGAFSQRATSGVTHKDAYGDSVESSKGAQKLAGGASAAIAMIPFIGSALAPFVGEWITSAIDRERDRANHDTKVANENISKISSISSALESIKDSGVGSADRNKAIEAFSKEIFSSENKETRELIEKHLGGNRSIYAVLQDINSNTEETAAAAMRELEIAQIQAEKAQVGGKYASQLYENQEAINETSSKIDDYSGWLEGNTIGTMAGVYTAGAVGTVATAATVAAIVGAANAWNPLGWAALLVAAIGGAAATINGTIIAGNAVAEENRKEYVSQTYALMSTNEKIDYFNDSLLKAEEAGDSEAVDNYKQMIQLLEKQASLQAQIEKEVNDLTLQESLIGTSINGKYITEMSIAELKNVGVGEILKAYAKEIDANGGIAGISFWDDESKTKLSNAGYEYLYTKLKKEGDEEITSVLSGESYTLNEALKLRDKFGPNDPYITRLLRSFADALNVSIDDLDSISSKYGELTYAENLLSTTELREKTDEFGSLVGEIVSGAGETSKWMDSIIQKYPELIAYMGDTPVLFDKIIEKSKQLTNAYLNAQAESMLSSTDFYKSIESDLFERISDDTAASLRKSNVTNLEGAITWALSQADGSTLKQEADKVMETIYSILDESQVKLTNDLLKAYYEKLVEFKTKTLDVQLKNLEEQKTALQQINTQREYENKLIEAKLKLEDAEKQKKRVYRAGVGWTYESDQAAIKKAQEELDNLDTEKKVSELEEQIKVLQAQKDELSNVYENENYETLKSLYETAVEQGDISSTKTNSMINDIKASVSGTSEKLSEWLEFDLAERQEKKTAAVKTATGAWNTLQAATPGTAEYNTALEAFHDLMSTAKRAGATKSDFAGLGVANDKQGSRIAGKSAWEVFSGDIDKQKSTVRYEFNLQDPGDSKNRFAGFMNGDLQYNSSILGWIFDDLKSGKGYIWDAEGNNVTNDIRYSISDKDENLLDFISRVGSEYGIDSMLITGWNGDNESIFVQGGKPYALQGYNNTNGLDLRKAREGDKDLFKQQFIQAAAGTLGLSSNSLGLINELGTEAIITPQGTLTALPSKSGIVPADITKNLWELGEIAPTLVRILDGRILPDTIGSRAFGTSTDESFNISNLEMNVNADASFDVDKFVNSIKSRVALTRNTK